MKSIISDLNKAFESRIRLGIMSVLSVNDSVDFNTLKDLLEATDGNLASHLKALEGLAYVRSERLFAGRKQNTQYIITELGREEFKKHISALESLLS